MGKFKNQDEIASYIITDFLSEEIDDYNNLLSNLDKLANRHDAFKLFDQVYLHEENGSKYQIISKFMIKHNKSLKKYIIEYEDTDSAIGMLNSTSSVQESLKKYSEYELGLGTYFAILGDEEDCTYAIFSVKSADNYIDVSSLVTFTLYIIGKKKDKYKRILMDEIKKVVKIKANDRKFFIRQISGNTKEVKFKSFDQMVFRDKERIINYIDNWCKHIPEYDSFGITPKLSILLYGDPGTGKSTFTKALAKYLDIHTVFSISPSFFYHSNDGENDYSGRGASILKSPFMDKILSIDDIDCICKSRDNDDSNENGAILSNLLEFLDNPDTFYFKPKDSDRYYPISIVIATTNYYNKLDPAVTRYGRFDLKIEMTEFDENEAIEFCNMYNLKLSDVYDKKIDKNFKISPSYLQSLCINKIDTRLKNN